MKTKFLTPTNIRLLVVVSFLGLIVLLIYALSGMPRPREANRVDSLTRSFSIIHPPDYDVSFTMGQSQPQYVTTIVASPKKIIGREIRFFSGEFKNPEDAQKLQEVGYNAITFQGQPALARGVKGKYTYSYTMVFSRGDRWFEISVLLQTEEDVPKGDWWPYFETFRAKPVAATQAVAAQPAATGP